MAISRRKYSNKRQRTGQSMIELAVVITVLLLLLVSMVEFGVLLNQYINVVDAARTAAREASVADPFADINKFIADVQKVTEKTLEPIVLNPAAPANDDIVISIFSVEKGAAPKRLFFPTGASKFGNHTSAFTNAQIQSKLDTSAPSTGLVLIEIFYGYPQILKLPVFTSVFPDPIPVRAYSIMPLSAAEPTPTPKP
jgi:hypothetical protein